MENHICSQLFQPIRVTKDSPHLRHCPLALLNLLLCRALLCTAVIVFLNLLCLFIGQNHTSQTRLIGNANSNTIIARFFHSITIYHITEHSDGLIHRSACESAVSGIRETVSQVFCKTICSEYTLIGLFQLGTNACLGSVCLVGNTNDIAAVRQQPCLFTKFLNRSNIDTTAWSISERFFHICTRFDATHITFV